MDIKCGTDIIEIERIKDSIESLNDKFLNRIYTKNEIDYCESKKSQKYQHYAARFAAKEAVFKAISYYMNDKYSLEWKNIEILNNEQGRPEVKIQDININREIKNIDISISHCKQYAVANVIVIFN